MEHKGGTIFEKIDTIWSQSRKEADELEDMLCTRKRELVDQGIIDETITKVPRTCPSLSLYLERATSHNFFIK